MAPMATEQIATQSCHGKSTADLPCPNHHIHPFNVQELRVGSNSNRQPYFRAMIFFNKKPGITDEFFHEHWKSVHADLTMQVQDAGVTLARYVQFHQEAKDKKAISPLLESGGFKLLQFDGAAEFHCKDAESFVKFMNDVYSAKHLVGCGTRFVDITVPYSVMVGYDNLIFGNAISSSGGSDGILAGDSRLKSVGDQVQLANSAVYTNISTTTRQAESGTLTVKPVEAEAVLQDDGPSPELKAPTIPVDRVQAVDSHTTPCL